jgi:hypothetical protein
MQTIKRHVFPENPFKTLCDDQLNSRSAMGNDGDFPRRSAAVTLPSDHDGEVAFPDVAFFDNVALTDEEVRT